MTAFARLVPRDGNEFWAEKIFEQLKTEQTLFEESDYSNFQLVKY
jgi:hypothetical protein